MEHLEESDDSGSIWQRVLFMLLFFLIYSVAEFVVFAVAVIQAGFVVLSGSRNRLLLNFGDRLTKYVYQITQFFVFKSNKKPFPFSDWPKVGSSNDN